MKSKIILTVVCILALLGYGFFPFGQREYSKINDAILKGEAENIGVYFGNDVDLTLLNNNNKYSKSQAVKVLKEFFKKNPPLEFSSNSNRTYVSGRMTTEDGESFYLNYTLKNRGNQLIITDMTIKHGIF